MCSSLPVIHFYHERTHDAAGQDGEEPAEAGVCAGSVLGCVYVWSAWSRWIVPRVMPTWACSTKKVGNGGLMAWRTLTLTRGRIRTPLLLLRQLLLLLLLLACLRFSQNVGSLDVS